MQIGQIPRLALGLMQKKVKANKVLLLLGARRVGKTSLIKEYIKDLDATLVLLLNAEDQNVVNAFSSQTMEHFRRLIGKHEYLIIDEAQHIPEIGKKLKLIVDEIPGIKVIATGSSVFDLNNKLGEPLVGRQNTLQLFPIAQAELNNVENLITTQALLQERLIYGTYPEVLQLSSYDEKASYLDELVNAYLLRDILAFDGIKKSGKLLKLLQLIALQLGNEVSVDELAGSIQGISRNTVERYLDLLEKVFVIYKMGGYSRNLRKEVTKSSKWFFYDNGIRNALIQNYNALDLRMDTGQLWENYLMSERRKHHHYQGNRVSQYFWRTYDQQEIDLVEEQAGQLSAYEFKWNRQKKVKSPAAWTNAYPKADFMLINPDNYLSFVG